VLVFPVRVGAAIDRVPQLFGVGQKHALPQWVSLPIIFLGVAAVMTVIAERVGRLFSAFAPLEAYRLDVLGSIAGIAAFSALSFADAGPFVWIVVAVAVLVFLLRTELTWFVCVSLAVLLLLGVVTFLQPRDIWSPYQHVTYAAHDDGTISIRVFVLPPKPKKGTEKEAALPLDLEEGEEFMLDEKGATPVSSYLESGRGKRCVVYLVNGQRQESDDNSFIVQELGFRYLRARMMVMADVDGLAQEAIGQVMQGSRQGFYRGSVRDAITKRIVATLKEDPDLLRLEQEAEEAVSELSAGDEKVKQTLDQLIDSHHDKGHSLVEGIGHAAGDQNGDELGFKKVNKGGVVTLLPPETGQAADYPVLMSQPAASIKPAAQQGRGLIATCAPSARLDAARPGLGPIALRMSSPRPRCASAMVVRYVHAGCRLVVGAGTPRRSRLPLKCSGPPGTTPGGASNSDPSRTLASVLPK
jgi:hypothetical protein